MLILLKSTKFTILRLQELVFLQNKIENFRSYCVPKHMCIRGEKVRRANR